MSSVPASPLHPAVLPTMIRTTLDALPVNPDATEEETALQRETALIDLRHLAPMDPAQARLAARIVTAHYMSMECMRRAARPGLPDSLIMRLQGRSVALDRVRTEAQRQFDKLKAAARAEAATATPAPQPPASKPPAQHALPANPSSPQGQLVRKDPLQREKPKQPAAAALSSQEEKALVQQLMNDLLDRSSVSIAALTAGQKEMPDAA